MSQGSEESLGYAHETKQILGAISAHQAKG